MNDELILDNLDISISKENLVVVHDGAVDFYHICFTKCPSTTVSLSIRAQLGAVRIYPETIIFTPIDALIPRLVVVSTDASSQVLDGTNGTSLIHYLTSQDYKYDKATFKLTAFVLEQRGPSLFASGENRFHQLGVVNELPKPLSRPTLNPKLLERHMSPTRYEYSGSDNELPCGLPMNHVHHILQDHIKNKKLREGGIAPRDPKEISRYLARETGRIFEQPVPVKFKCGSDIVCVAGTSTTTYFLHTDGCLYSSSSHKRALLARDKPQNSDILDEESITDTKDFNKNFDQSIIDSQKSGNEGNRSFNNLKIAQKTHLPRLISISDFIIQVACGTEHVVLLSMQGTVRTFGSCTWGQLGVPPSVVFGDPEWRSSLRCTEPIDDIIKKLSKNVEAELETQNVLNMLDDISRQASKAVNASLVKSRLPTPPTTGNSESAIFHRKYENRHISQSGSYNKNSLFCGLTSSFLSTLTWGAIRSALRASNSSNTDDNPPSPNTNSKAPEPKLKSQHIDTFNSTINDPFTCTGSSLWIEKPKIVPLPGIATQIAAGGHISCCILTTDGIVNPSAAPTDISRNSMSRPSTSNGLKSQQQRQSELNSHHQMSPSNTSLGVLYSWGETLSGANGHSLGSSVTSDFFLFGMDGVRDKGKTVSDSMNSEEVKAESSSYISVKNVFGGNDHEAPPPLQNVQQLQPTSTRRASSALQPVVSDSVAYLSSISCHMESRCVCYPLPLAGLPIGLDVLRVKCGRVHTALLMSDGHVYTLGDGTSGRLGLGHDRSVRNPTKVKDLGLCISIDCGSDHTGALDSSRRVWLWGLNASGQIGFDPMHLPSTSRPLHVSLLDDKGVVSLTLGDSTSAVTTVHGSCHVWGGEGLISIKSLSGVQELDRVRTALLYEDNDISNSSSGVLPLAVQPDLDVFSTKFEKDFSRTKAQLLRSFIGDKQEDIIKGSSLFMSPDKSDSFKTLSKAYFNNVKHGTSPFSSPNSNYQKKISSTTRRSINSDSSVKVSQNIMTNSRTSSFDTNSPQPKITSKGKFQRKSSIQTDEGNTGDNKTLDEAASVIISPPKPNFPNTSISESPYTMSNAVCKSHLGSWNVSGSEIAPSHNSSKDKSSKKQNNSKIRFASSTLIENQSIPQLIGTMLSTTVRRVCIIQNNIFFIVNPMVPGIKHTSQRKIIEWWHHVMADDLISRSRYLNTARNFLSELRKSIRSVGGILQQQQSIIRARPNSSRMIYLPSNAFRSSSKRIQSSNRTIENYSLKDLNNSSTSQHTNNYNNPNNSRTESFEQHKISKLNDFSRPIHPTKAKTHSNLINTPVAPRFSKRPHHAQALRNLNNNLSSSISSLKKNPIRAGNLIANNALNVAVVGLDPFTSRPTITPFFGTLSNNCIPAAESTLSSMNGVDKVKFANSYASNYNRIDTASLHIPVVALASARIPATDDALLISHSNNQNSNPSGVLQNENMYADDYARLKVNPGLNNLGRIDEGLVSNTTGVSMSELSRKVDILAKTEAILGDTELESSKKLNFNSESNQLPSSGSLKPNTYAQPSCLSPKEIIQSMYNYQKHSIDVHPSPTFNTASSTRKLNENQHTGDDFHLRDMSNCIGPFQSLFDLVNNSPNEEVPFSEKQPSPKPIQTSFQEFSSHSNGEGYGLSRDRSSEQNINLRRYSGRNRNNSERKNNNTNNAISSLNNSRRGFFNQMTEEQMISVVQGSEAFKMAYDETSCGLVPMSSESVTSGSLLHDISRFPNQLLYNVNERQNSNKSTNGNFDYGKNFETYEGSKLHNNTAFDAQLKMRTYDDKENLNYEIPETEISFMQSGLISGPKTDLNRMTKQLTKKLRVEQSHLGTMNIPQSTQKIIQATGQRIQLLTLAAASPAVIKTPGILGLHPREVTTLPTPDEIKIQNQANKELGKQIFKLICSLTLSNNATERKFAGRAIDFGFVSDYLLKVIESQIPGATPAIIRQVASDARRSLDKFEVSLSLGDAKLSEDTGWPSVISELGSKYLLDNIFSTNSSASTGNSTSHPTLSRFYKDVAQIPKTEKGFADASTDQRICTVFDIPAVRTDAALLVESLRSPPEVQSAAAAGHHLLNLPAISKESLILRNLRVVNSLQFCNLRPEITTSKSPLPKHMPIFNPGEDTAKTALNFKRLSAGSMMVNHSEWEDGNNLTVDGGMSIPQHTNEVTLFGDCFDPINEVETEYLNSKTMII